MTERNALLLHRVAYKVDKFPERHYQSSWASLDRMPEPGEDPSNFCGTRGCIAGWASMIDLDGKLVPILDKARAEAIATYERRKANGLVNDWETPERPNLEEVINDAIRVEADADNTEASTIHGYAQEKLGLTDDEANVLFGGSWKPRDHDMSVGDALRELAEGASIADITPDELLPEEMLADRPAWYRVESRVSLSDAITKLATTLGGDAEDDDIDVMVVVMKHGTRDEVEEGAENKAEQMRQAGTYTTVCTVERDDEYDS